MRFLRVNWTLAAAVLLLGQALASAQDVELTNDYDQSGPSAVEGSVAGEYAAEVPADGGGGTCQVCNGAGCPSCTAGVCPNCNGAGCSACNAWGRGRSLPVPDPCPQIGWYSFAGVDTFRGVSDGTHQNNNGAATGLNGAVPVPWLSEYGVGAQFGASYGAYDFSGQSTPAPGSFEVQQQIFITTGFYRRANAHVPISFGFVHDWMINNQFGTFSNSPTVGQWRVQVAWAMSASNEIGVWGSYRDLSAMKMIDVNGVPTTQTYQAIDQINAFWHHKWWQLGGDSWMYVGVPDRRRLNQDPANTNPIGSGASLGEIILGMNWMLPLNDCVSMYANAVYMKPSAHTGVAPNGAVAAAQEFWDISVGLAFYPQRTARSSTVAGRSWMPYMPLANNSNFFVDTNHAQ